MSRRGFSDTGTRVRPLLRFCSLSKIGTWPEDGLYTKSFVTVTAFCKHSATSSPAARQASATVDERKMTASL